MIQKEIYFITVFTLLVFCISCNQLDGAIEHRIGNKLYLVNKSKTKEFRFTVKVTKIINDTLVEYSTRQNQLAPGDELYLGNENGISEKQYPTIEKKILKTYLFKVLNDKFYYKDKKGDWYEQTKFDPNKTYETVGVLPDLRPDLIDKEDLSSYILLLKDTVIDSKVYKYHYIIENVKDSLHPFPQIRYKYIYAVTGQVEIKNTKSNASH